MQKKRQKAKDREAAERKADIAAITNIPIPMEKTEEEKKAIEDDKDRQLIRLQCGLPKAQNGSFNSYQIEACRIGLFSSWPAVRSIRRYDKNSSGTKTGAEALRYVEAMLRSDEGFGIDDFHQYNKDTVRGGNGAFLHWYELVTGTSTLQCKGQSEVVEADNSSGGKARILAHKPSDLSGKGLHYCRSCEAVNSDNSRLCTRDNCIIVQCLEYEEDKVPMEDKVEDVKMIEATPTEEALAIADAAITWSYHMHARLSKQDLSFMSVPGKNYTLLLNRIGMVVIDAIKSKDKDAPLKLPEPPSRDHLTYIMKNDTDKVKLMCDSGYGKAWLLKLIHWCIEYLENKPGGSKGAALIESFSRKNTVKVMTSNPSALKAASGSSTNAESRPTSKEKKVDRFVLKRGDKDVKDLMPLSEGEIKEAFPKIDIDSEPAKSLVVTSGELEYLLSAPLRQDYGSDITLLEPTSASNNSGEEPGIDIRLRNYCA